MQVSVIGLAPWETGKKLSLKSKQGYIIFGRVLSLEWIED